jgi:hypothetical protein
MRPEPVCPRCGARVRAPGLMSSAWTCELHGDVAPLTVRAGATAETIAWLTAAAEVPVWMPWPLPPGWMVTGLAHAGDERSGARAVATVLSGPAPFGGAGDLVLVAEEPGIGLGARYAKLPGPDPGIDAVHDRTIPDARIEAADHPTPLWSVQSTLDRAVFIGEAKGEWLWAVLWPETASLLVYDRLRLVDLRDVHHPLDLPFGAPSPRVQPDPVEG